MMTKIGEVVDAAEQTSAAASEVLASFFEPSRRSEYPRGEVSRFVKIEEAA